MSVQVRFKRIYSTESNSLQKGMKVLKKEIRLYVSEKLMYFALSILPEGSKQKQEFASLLVKYFNKD